MNDDNAPKKSWTSPTLEALEMASTAGGGDPSLKEAQFDQGGLS
ncbi:MAG TPA: hypothetical protein VMM59_06745 [Thermohalobaculum sp.]|nr:hypothetical protein [Thermohalobaculum sp.]